MASGEEIEWEGGAVEGGRNGEVVGALVFSESAASNYKRMRDLPHRSYNEALRGHTTFSVKLADTVTDFVHKLSSVEEQHAQQLHGVVKSFRKKTQENLKKDTSLSGSTQLTAWEALLKETEEEANACSELAHNLVQGMTNQLHELVTKKKGLLKRWFLFRDTYMGRIDKTEDRVNKMFREYQDHWHKYAEGMEKDPENVKEMVVLHSYNAHNAYILQKTAFNALHDEYYGRQVYDMLDELQAIHEDLVKGVKTSLQKCGEMMREKCNKSLSHLSSFADSATAVSATSDTSALVCGQNLAEKTYPPPQCQFRAPDLPPPKLPDSPPVNLPSLTDELQLNDLTQAPLTHSQENIKQTEFDVNGSLEQLHKEYQSVKSLLDSYRDNPTLGDPNTLIEELLEMRNKIRVKEAELVMIRAKLNLFTSLHQPPPSTSPELSLQLSSNPTSSPLLGGRPQKSSSVFTRGRDHDFVESEKKRPVLCGYCGGMIQPPISKGVKCKTCKISVHHRCQDSIPYCPGAPPPKPTSKSASKFAGMPKVSKRISQMLTRKPSSDVPESTSTGSFEDEDDGLYEPPPLAVPLPPRAQDRMNKMESPTHAPQPPPRGESLDPSKYARLENVLVHNSFEDTLELADTSCYCVALYDYQKVNPNDITLRCGDVIELINTGSPDWWKGTCNGNTGYFPASYVQTVSQGNHIMEALYDFTPQGPGELVLEEGQIVVMLRDNQDGWMFGRSGTEEGLFPQNYVKQLKTV